MTDLLERADALAVLSAAVASAGARPGTTAGGPAGAPSGAAAAGTAPGGRVVLVRGEAGVGKSSLVRALAETHGDRARVLVGACDPLLTPRALGPLHDVAREVGGPLAALLDEGAPREQVFTALLDEVSRPGPPTVLVVEDAHWADEATLDLLLFLARRIVRAGAVLVVTYRDDEVGVEHPLQAVVGRLPQDAVDRVHLHPLSAAGVAELARRAGRSVGGLHALTGGNPLLVTEVLATPDAAVPVTVRDLVLARLATLSPRAQDAVRLAAVVPTRAELWLLERALGDAVTDVDDGVAAGLLVADGDAVRFRHELLRRAVEGALSAVARRRLNRQVLAVLAEAVEEVDLARLVHHARQAHDVDAVCLYAPEAARRAAAVGSHREAIGHYRVALEHADRFEAPTRADLLESLSIECYLTGRSAEAVAARSEAVLLREALGEEERTGAGLRWLSRMRWWNGERAAAEEAAARAIEVLEPLGPSHDLAMAYSNRSQLDMLAHRLDSAIAWANRAIDLAERLGDRHTLSHALTNIGSARLHLRDPAGVDDLERAFAVADEAGLADDAARALANLSTIPSELRDADFALPALDRGLAYMRAHELTGYLQHLLGHRARVRLETGDWPGAEADARASLAEPTAGGAQKVDALVPLGLLQARRGDPEAAATLAAALDSGFATEELQWTAPVAAARAELAWLEGRDADVAAEARRSYRSACDARHSWFVGELAFWLRVAGEREEVPDVVAAPWAAVLAGDWRASAELFAAKGFVYQRALVLAVAGDDDARLAALDVLDGLGARATALRVRRDLRRGGRRAVPRGPIRATAAGPAGLTPRQVEVLRLVAEGLTDAEIAARLLLSPKTVGHHVSAVLAKLGVASRREAADEARRRGIDVGGVGAGVGPADG